MHETLSDPLELSAPWVMTGGMDCKERKHTAIPVFESLTVLAVNLVLNVETPACRTRVCAGAAVEACKRNIFPKRRCMQL